MKPQKPSSLDTTSPIAWHPAFVEAIQLELEAYRNFLEFHTEYPLTSEPLKIDCVVIKKAKDIIISKNFAAMFREVNLIEYKSPYDYISIADFYKVYAYACLYTSLENTPITSLTISLIESRHPKELLSHLKRVRGYTVEKKSPGIYTVNGDILPIQIIDSRQLSADLNFWLKGLSNKLDPLSIIQISDEVIKLNKNSRVKAYVDVLARANFRAIEEAKNMSSPAKSLDEVLVRTGLAAQWEARGEERKAINMAKKMLNSGFSLETVAAISELDSEKLKTLYEQ